jgi:hypothetical protein
LAFNNCNDHASARGDSGSRLRNILVLIGGDRNADTYSNPC